MTDEPMFNVEIERTSPLTGIKRKRIFPMTKAQLKEIQLPKSQRRPIQTVLPHLTLEEREFIMTGYTQDDWDQMFPPEDDNDE